MEAIVMERFGGPDVLQPAVIPGPTAEPGWAVVALRAAALNWHDVLVREGRYGSPLPHVPGADGAGSRVDTGEDVVILPSLWWGDRPEAPAAGWEILGDKRHGTYAEQVKVPEECVFPKPSAISWAQAATLGVAGVTAYRALFTRGQLRAGESVLLLGAGSGVTTMGVALAAAVGARVFVTSSSNDKIARSREIGAVDGVCYLESDWAREAVSLTPGGDGFDLVVDSVGSTWPESVAATRPGGRIVVFGASGGDTTQLDVRPFYFGQYSLLGTTMGTATDFRALLGFMDTHPSVRPVVDHETPLADAASAQRRLEQHEHVGNLVLSIA